MENKAVPLTVEDGEKLGGTPAAPTSDCVLPTCVHLGALGDPGVPGCLREHPGQPESIFTLQKERQPGGARQGRRAGGGTRHSHWKP